MGIPRNDFPCLVLALAAIWASPTSPAEAVSIESHAPVSSVACVDLDLIDGAVCDAATEAAGEPRTCRCGSTEPALKVESERLTPGDDADVEDAALASRFVVASSRGQHGDIAAGLAMRLRRPLYLLTTHLRF